MRPQTVMMTEGGAKAYFAALKKQREEIAAYYQEHNVLISETAKFFKVSPWTVTRALAEFGVEVDRNRQYQRTHHSFKCSQCKKIVKHFCKPANEKKEVEQLKKDRKELNPSFTQKEASHRTQERTDVPPGTPKGWTPEMVAQKVLMDAWVKKHGRLPNLQEMMNRVWEQGESEQIN